MDKNINEAIEEIKEDIETLKLQIQLLENLDLSKSVDEDIWHNICETPLRSSDILGVLVKNIFPLAENIIVHCNYVYFDMLGFKVQIPTSRCRGINVDLSWYHNYSKPQLYYPSALGYLIKYFEAVDNNLGWYEKMKCRVSYGEHCKKYILFLAYIFKYKWKKVNRELVEEEKEKFNQSYQKQVIKYYKDKSEIHQKSEKLINELLPLLDNFSKQHLPYNQGSPYGTTIEKIKELEDL